DAGAPHRVVRELCRQGPRHDGADICQRRAMVLIQRLFQRIAVLGVLAGCSQSLFDENGATSDSANIPLTCPTPCLADAATDFNRTPPGAGGKGRYLADQPHRPWRAMTGDATQMTGADPNNHITTCAAHRTAAACVALPGALLVSSAGATSAADPALEITATQSQVIQLVVRAFVPSGVDQSIR